MHIYTIFKFIVQTLPEPPNWHSWLEIAEISRIPHDLKSNFCKFKYRQSYGRSQAESICYFFLSECLSTYLPKLRRTPIWVCMKDLLSLARSAFEAIFKGCTKAHEQARVGKRCFTFLSLF